MRSKPISAFVMLSILLLLASSTATLTRAADYTHVGVATGDWARYDLKTNFYAYSTYTGMNVTIKGISGTRVALGMIYYAGNTSYPGPDGIIDVNSGEGQASYLLIAGNLSVYDAIYPGISYSLFRINETRTVTFAGAPRSVNHLNVTYYANRFDVYWDKSSGMAVKAYICTAASNAWINFTMTATNIWNASSGGGLFAGIDATGFAIVVITLAVVIAVTAIVLRGRGQGTLPKPAESHSDGVT